MGRTGRPNIRPIVTRRENVSNPKDDGPLQVDIIANDGDLEHSIQLIAVKELIYAGLSSMLKEYVVRVVFDRSHRSVVLSRDGFVIAALTFRPFYPQRLIEVVFCVVERTEMKKGYGTRLMNEMKEHAKVQGFTHLHTYADNSALPYFQKQGFTKDISTPKDRW